jgi:hypothetical protein
VLNEGTQAEIEAWLLTFPLFTSFNTAGAPAASLFDLCAQRYNNRLSSFFCFSPQSKVAAQRSSICVLFRYTELTAKSDSTGGEELARLNNFIAAWCRAHGSASLVP